MTQPANRRLATEQHVADVAATKVNSSTYTAGLSGKQDAATLVADTAAHVADGSVLDVALKTALVSRVKGIARTAAAFASHAAPVMTTPPTVTLSVNTSATALTNAVYRDVTSPAIRYFGGPPVATTINGRNTRKNGVNNGPNPPFGFDFMSDAPNVELLLLNTTASGGGYRIRVNGEYISLTPTNITTSVGVLNRVTIAFGSAAVRHIEVELLLLNFFSIVVAAPHDAWEAARPRPLTTLVYGDSVGYGTGADSGFTAWPYTMARELGLQRNLLNNSEGGTGYLNPGPGGQNLENFYDRIAANVAQGLAPDVVILAGGTNDGTDKNVAYTPTALTAEVRRCLQLIRTSWPNAIVILMGAWLPNFSVSQSVRDAVTASNTAVLAAANEPNVFGTVDMSSWITSGTTGNQTRYLPSDSIHPVQAGHDYYGTRAAAAIRTLLRAAA